MDGRLSAAIPMAAPEPAAGHRDPGCGLRVANVVIKDRNRIVESVYRLLIELLPKRNRTGLVWKGDSGNIHLR